MIEFEIYIYFNLLEFQYNIENIEDITFVQEYYNKIIRRRHFNGKLSISRTKNKAIYDKINEITDINYTIGVKILKKENSIIETYYQGIILYSDLTFDFDNCKIIAENLTTTDDYYNYIEIKKERKVYAIDSLTGISQWDDVVYRLQSKLYARIVTTDTSTYERIDKIGRNSNVSTSLQVIKLYEATDKLPYGHSEYTESQLQLLDDGNPAFFQLTTRWYKLQDNLYVRYPTAWSIAALNNALLLDRPDLKEVGTLTYSENNSVTPPTYTETPTYYLDEYPEDHYYPYLFPGFSLKNIIQKIFSDLNISINFGFWGYQMENYFASTLNLVNHRAKKDHKQQHLSITFAEFYEILKSLSVELEIETLPNGEKNINFISYSTAWQNNYSLDLTTYAENFINKFEIEEVPGIEEITSNDTEKGYFSSCEAVYNKFNTNKNSISLNYQADLEEIIKNNSSGDNLVLIHSELTDTLNRRLVKQTEGIYNYELSPAGIYRKYYRYEAPGNNVTIFRNNEVLFGGNLSAYQRRVKIYQEVEIPLCAGDILKYKLVKTPYGIGEIINVEENLKKNTYKIKIKY